jgi:hypothetical protein
MDEIDLTRSSPEPFIYNPIVKHHDVKAYGGEEAQRHAFFTSASG